MANPILRFGPWYDHKPVDGGPSIQPTWPSDDSRWETLMPVNCANWHKNTWPFQARRFTRVWIDYNETKNWSAQTANPVSGDLTISASVPTVGMALSLETEIWFRYQAAVAFTLNLEYVVRAISTTSGDGIAGVSIQYNPIALPVGSTTTLPYFSQTFGDEDEAMLEDSKSGTLTLPPAIFPSPVGITMRAIADIEGTEYEGLLSAYTYLKISGLNFVPA